MSKQQRDAIDAALRAEPFGLNQSTDGHRTSFDGFALRPVPGRRGRGRRDPGRSPRHRVDRRRPSRRTPPCCTSTAAGTSPDPPGPAPTWRPSWLIQVGSHEVLLDDAVRLAANAGRDDVDVTLQVAPEGTHVFQLYFGALGDEAIDEVARFFTRHLMNGFRNAGLAGR